MLGSDLSFVGEALGSRFGPKVGLRLELRISAGLLYVEPEISEQAPSAGQKTSPDLKASLSDAAAEGALEQ